MQRTANLRMGSWATNLTTVSYAVSGLLGIPLVFGSVFALAMTPVRKSQVRHGLERRQKALKLAA